MPYIAYEDTGRISTEVQRLIDTADVICQQYARQGDSLTLRQLYYQFVSRDLIPNTQRDYKRLGNAVSKGRMIGQIDWDHITDRGRVYRNYRSYRDPVSFLRRVATGYYRNIWEGQPFHVEVWVEKQALEDVVARACEEDRVGYLACKGYMSQSEMWEASQRYIRKFQAGTVTDVVILHLGDHDPSGIDMTRDIQDRLRLFLSHEGYGTNWSGTGLEVKRIALNMDQVEQYDPPPNPAKITDSRAQDYIANHGYESWELDALEPAVLRQLIQDHVDPFVNREVMDEQREREERESALIEEMIDEVGDRMENDLSDDEE